MAKSLALSLPPAKQGWIDLRFTARSGLSESTVGVIAKPMGLQDRLV